MLQLLERKDLLNADMPLAEGPAVRFEYAVVTHATVADLPATDRTAHLPESIAATHEWAPFAVEVWVRGEGEVPVHVQQLTFDLNYRTDLTSAVDVQFGKSFEGERSFSLADATGEVQQISAASAGVTLGEGDRVLFARIFFQAVPQNGDNVRLDFETGSVGPYSLELAAANVGASYQGHALDITQSAMPDTGLYAVIYDLDDDQRVGLSDFALFAASYGNNSPSAEGDATWFADFDKSGRVDLPDFALFVQNFGKNYLSDKIVFPPGYPEAWDAIEADDDDDDQGDDGGGTVVIPGDPNDPDPPPVPPVRPRFDLNELFNWAPGIILPGTHDVFQLVIGTFNLHNGIQLDRLTANASLSGEGEEVPGDAVLTIVLQDDEIYETEIEIVFDGQLVDTVEEFTQYGGFITQYVSEVMSSLQGMLDDLLASE